jgi:hypothetical protein
LWKNEKIEEKLHSNNNKGKKCKPIITIFKNAEGDSKMVARGRNQKTCLLN